MKAIIKSILDAWVIVELIFDKTCQQWQQNELDEIEAEANEK